MKSTLLAPPARREQAIDVDVGAACRVCGRSALFHKSGACRTCRKGKPADWVAPEPKLIEIEPVLEERERRVSLGGWRERSKRTWEAKVANDTKKSGSKDAMRLAEPWKCVFCDFTTDWPPSVGRHKGACKAKAREVAKPKRAKPSKPKVETPDEALDRAGVKLDGDLGDVRSPELEFGPIAWTRDPEVAAIGAISVALEPLDLEARDRVVSYAMQRFLPALS